MNIPKQNLEPTPPNPEAEILALNDEVFDLRNRLLFDRVGQDGMQALADSHAEKGLFDQLEASVVTPESLALSTIFKDQAYNDLSREMFEGRNFSELTALERLRVEGAQRELDTHKAASGAMDVGAVNGATQEQEQLDIELNRVFNDQLTGYLFDGSRQAPGKLDLYGYRNTGIPMRDGMTAMPGLVVKEVDGKAKAVNTLDFVDAEGQKIDMNRLAEEEHWPQDAKEEMARFEENMAGIEVFPEQVEAVQQGMQRVKAYLEQHLDPTVNAPRQGKYGPEPAEG